MWRNDNDKHSYMNPFQRSTIILAFISRFFLAKATPVQPQLPSEVPQDRPFLLRIGQQNCACLGAKFLESLGGEFPSATIYREKSYSCSCRSLNNSNLQAQDLQTVLQKLHANDRVQRSCRCGSAPSAVDNVAMARMRRAPYSTSQWQCSCGNTAPLYYREPLAPYYLADVPSKYFSAPIPQRGPILYQIVAKSKSHKSKDPPATKVAMKEDVKETKNNEKSYDVGGAKNGNVESGASKCPCFDIILKFQRNEPSAEAAKPNAVYSDEKYSPEANCACQQFPLMDSPSKAVATVGGGNGHDVVASHQYDQGYANYDDIVDEFSYNQQQPKGEAGSMPCILIRLNHSPSQDAKQQQIPPSPQQPCACQKDYVPCAANRCCPTTQQVSRDELSKARTNVDLLMNFLSKFKESLVR